MTEWLDDSPSCIQVTAVGVRFGAALLGFGRVFGGLVGRRDKAAPFVVFADGEFQRGGSGEVKFLRDGVKDHQRFFGKAEVLGLRFSSRAGHSLRIRREGYHCQFCGFPLLDLYTQLR